MATYNIHEAKSQLSKLIEAVRDGDEVIIAKAGKPVAVLGPLVPSRISRVRGLLRDEPRLDPGFDEELPSDILDLFEGKN